MTPKMKEALELADKLKSLRQELVEGKRVHGGLGFSGRSLEILQKVERFFFLSGADGARFKQAYELAAGLQIMRCARGGSTRQDVAVHELGLLIPMLEQLSEEKPSITSETEPPRPSLSRPDSPEEAQRGTEQPRRFSSQIESTVAARRVTTYLEESNGRSGMTMQAFAELAGTTYKTLAKFLKTGRLRRSILESIAKRMGLTLEQLLSTEGEQQESTLRESSK